MRINKKYILYLFECMILLLFLAACAANTTPASPAAAPAAAQLPTETPTAADQINAEAWVSNPTPAHDDRVIVYSSLIKNQVFLAGIMMNASWYDPLLGRQRQCNLLVTYQRGDCIIEVKDFPIGKFVPVTVSFDYGNRLYTTSTGFTPKE